MKIVIDIPEMTLLNITSRELLLCSREDIEKLEFAIKNGTPLTSDVLADLLMEERIKGELKQDISYSKNVIDDVECRLTVNIRDHRPCYCGAELREVWRESEDKE